MGKEKLYFQILKLAKRQKAPFGQNVLTSCVTGCGFAVLVHSCKDAVIKIGRKDIHTSCTCTAVITIKMRN